MQNGGGGGGKIGEMERYFKSLSPPQKREFAGNLRRRISGVNDSRYRAFLERCELECEKLEKNGALGPNLNPRPSPKPAAPKKAFSAESFAAAFTSVLQGGAPAGRAAAARLLGIWRREQGGRVFYFVFRKDGSFETNERRGEKFSGRFIAGLDGVLLLEPPVEPAVTGITVAYGYLAVEYADGASYEYKMKHSEVKPLNREQP